MHTRKSVNPYRNVEDAISISGVDYIILAPALIKKLATMPGDFGPPNLTREVGNRACRWTYVCLVPRGGGFGGLGRTGASHGGCC
eukprot:1378603-Amorphochlora_amoeboformis.AAC.1